MENQVFDIKECAKYLHCSETNVRLRIREGKLKSFRVGAIIRIRKEKADEFIAAQEESASEQENCNKIDPL